MDVCGIDWATYETLDNQYFLDNYGVSKEEFKLINVDTGISVDSNTTIMPTVDSYNAVESWTTQVTIGVNTYYANTIFNGSEITQGAAVSRTSLYTVTYETENGEQTFYAVCVDPWKGSPAGSGQYTITKCEGDAYGVLNNRSWLVGGKGGDYHTIFDNAGVCGSSNHYEWSQYLQDNSFLCQSMMFQGVHWACAYYHSGSWPSGKFDGLTRECLYGSTGTYYEVNTGDGDKQRLIFLGEAPSVPAYAYVKKSSTKPAVTDNNANYSYEGITYGIYTWDGTSYVQVGSDLTLNTLGDSSVVELDVGTTYYLHEKSVPENCGYVLDDSYHEFTVSKENTENNPKVISISNQPMHVPVQVKKSSANEGISGISAMLLATINSSGNVVDKSKFTNVELITDTSSNTDEDDSLFDGNKYNVTLEVNTEGNPIILLQPNYAAVMKEGTTKQFISGSYVNVDLSSETTEGLYSMGIEIVAADGTILAASDSDRPFYNFRMPNEDITIKVKYTRDYSEFNKNTVKINQYGSSNICILHSGANFSILTNNDTLEFPTVNANGASYSVSDGAGVPLGSGEVGTGFALQDGDGNSYSYSGSFSYCFYHNKPSAIGCTVTEVVGPNPTGLGETYTATQRSQLCSAILSNSYTIVWETDHNCAVSGCSRIGSANTTYCHKFSYGGETYYVCPWHMHALIAIACSEITGHTGWNYSNDTALENQFYRYVTTDAEKWYAYSGDLSLTLDDITNGNLTKTDADVTTVTVNDTSMYKVSFTANVSAGYPYTLTMPAGTAYGINGGTPSAVNSSAYTVTVSGNTTIDLYAPTDSFSGTSCTIPATPSLKGSVCDIAWYINSNSSKQSLVTCNPTTKNFSVSVTFPSEKDVQVKKTSSDLGANVTGNVCYDLTGTTYKLYTDQACTKQATDVDGNPVSFVCDTNGDTTAVNMPLGTYYLKETKAGKGYKLDTAVYTVSVTATGDNPQIIEVTDDPVDDPIRIALTKTNSNGQGLKGAVYCVEFYPGIQTYNEASAQANHSGSVSRWYLKTGDNGRAAFNATSLDTTKNNSAFYLDELGKETFPLGTVVIYEVEAPLGYQVDETHYVFKVKQESEGSARAKLYEQGADGSDVLAGGIQAENSPTVLESPLPVELTLTKVNSDTNPAQGNTGDVTLDGAVFALYAKRDIMDVAAGTVKTPASGTYNVRTALKFSNGDPVLDAYGKLVAPLGFERNLISLKLST